MAGKDTKNISVRIKNIL